MRPHSNFHGRHEGAGGHGGRGGHGGHGRHGGRGGGGGGPGSRVFHHGALRLVVLALIAEAPRHGYEIIKAIEEHPGESRREWMLLFFSEAGESNSNNKDFQFWQQHNKPIALTTNEMIARYLNYLHENPVKEGYVEFAEDDVYCSAPAIARKPGLLKLEVL